MLRPFVLALAAAALTACGGLPPNTVREQGARTVIESPESPAVVYERVVTGSRACFERAFEVVSDYFPARQAGTVSVAMRMPVAHSALYVADIRPAAAGSVVTVSMHPSAASRRLGEAALSGLREWIATGSARCDA